MGLFGIGGKKYQKINNIRCPRCKSDKIISAYSDRFQCKSVSTSLVKRAPDKKIFFN